MAATRFPIRFEDSSPTIEAIADRFRELTGLSPVVSAIGPDSYALSSRPLQQEVELTIGRTIDVVVFRIRLGYLEWSVLRTLHSLGGRVPARGFPRWAVAPWTTLPRYQQWLHR